MSQYSQNVKTLLWLQALTKSAPDLKFTITCRIVNQEGVWKDHQLTQIGTAHGWLNNNREHDCYVSIQIEGLKSTEDRRRNAESFHPRCNGDIYESERKSRRERLGLYFDIGPSVSTTLLSRRQQDVIRKLERLAASTPYAEEAKAARRKIREMEQRSSSNHPFGSESPDNPHDPECASDRMMAPHPKHTVGDVEVDWD